MELHFFKNRKLRPQSSFHHMLEQHVGPYFKCASCMPSFVFFNWSGVLQWISNSELIIISKLFSIVSFVKNDARHWTQAIVRVSQDWFVFCTVLACVVVLLFGHRRKETFDHKLIMAANTAFSPKPDLYWCPGDMSVLKNIPLKITVYSNG